jgi:hypothetical protein
MAVAKPQQLNKYQYDSVKLTFNEDADSNTPLPIELISMFDIPIEQGKRKSAEISTELDIVAFCKNNCLNQNKILELT